MRVTCDALAVRNRSGCLETAPTTRSAGTTTCWPQGSCQSSVQRTKHRRSERHRVQGRSPHRRTQRGRSAEAIDARRTYNRRVESNEPTTPSRTAASGTFAPEAASRTSTKCSSNDERGDNQEAPSSRYENYSMTPSPGVVSWRFATASITPKSPRRLTYSPLLYGLTCEVVCTNS